MRKIFKELICVSCFIFLFSVRSWAQPASGQPDRHPATAHNETDAGGGGGGAPPPGRGFDHIMDGARPDPTEHILEAGMSSGHSPDVIHPSEFRGGAPEQDEQQRVHRRPDEIQITSP
jgi:hypothetical protein